MLWLFSCCLQADFILQLCLCQLQTFRLEMPHRCTTSTSFSLPPFSLLSSNMPFFKLALLQLFFFCIHHSSFQLSVPWMSHAISGSLILLWHSVPSSQSILSLPLPCSSLGTAHSHIHLLSLSPRLFPFLSQLPSPESSTSPLLCIAHVLYKETAK